MWTLGMLPCDEFTIVDAVAVLAFTAPAIEGYDRVWFAHCVSMGEALAEACRMLKETDAAGFRWSWGMTLEDAPPEISTKVAQ